MARNEALGRFTFVLHSHLPYVVNHGTWPHGMNWISEAAAETYIPLWRAFSNLSADRKKLAVTIGFSPVLAEQLRHPHFVDSFLAYLKEKREAAAHDKQEFEKIGDTRLATLADFWRSWYQAAEEDFTGPLGRDIVGGFARLQDEGAIEIITCGATHGYLPLLGNDEAVNAQVELAVNAYRKHFHRDPKGIWLPECAYRPAYEWKSPVDEDAEPFERKGVEEVLQEHGLRYFVVDTHLLKGGKAMGTYLARFEGLKRIWERSSSHLKEKDFQEAAQREPYQVYWLEGTPDGGGEGPVGILTRDQKTSLQVWSGEYGYPGDGNYLDFHKKHFPGGHRYWKVTRSDADLGEKEVYSLDPIEGRVSENAEHFSSLLHDVMEQAGVEPGKRFVVSPFDTELFGHWWFEGPRWLEKVLERIAESDDIEPATGSELVLDAEGGDTPVVKLPEGSWGEGGHHYIWLNDETAWTWPLIHEAEESMRELARRHAGASGELNDLLQQLGRELLLLESSDWQFLISTVAAADYAELRLRKHYQDFVFLRELVEKVASGGELTYEERERYEAILRRDDIFEDLDISMWA